MSLMKNLRSFYPLNAMGQRLAALDHIGSRHLQSDGLSGTFPLHAEGGFNFVGSLSENIKDTLTDSPLDFDALGPEWSIAFDLYISGADTGCIMSKDAPLASPNVKRSFRLMRTGMTLQLLLTGDASSASVTATATADTWNRVVIVKADDTIIVRVDGVEVSAAAAFNLRALTDVPLQFGRYTGSNSSTQTTDGGIKNLMVWSRALTLGERTELADDLFIPPLRWQLGERFHLTILAGQSLVSGQSAGTPSGTEAFERDSVAVSSTQNTNVNLTRWHYAGRSVIGIGPIMGMLQATPSDGIVVHGVSGSNLDEDWDPIAPGPYWSALETRVLRTKNDLVSLGLVPAFDYFVWLQGSGDATETRAPLYGANLTTLMSESRDLVGNDNMIFAIASDWNDATAIGNYGTYLGDVVDAKAAVAAADPLAVLVTQVGYSRVDHVHMDWEAVTVWGRDAVKKMQSLRESFNVDTAISVAEAKAAILSVLLDKFPESGRAASLADVAEVGADVDAQASIIANLRLMIDESGDTPTFVAPALVNAPSAEFTVVTDELVAGVKAGFTSSQILLTPLANFVNNSEIRLRQGDTYLAAKSTAWEKTIELAGFDFTAEGLTARFGAGNTPGVPLINGSATLLEKAVGSCKLRLEFDRNDTKEVAPTEYRWDAEVVDSDGDVRTLDGGTLQLEPSWTELT
ncbi:hypothetical protein K227x_64260 [Rubripirellula lacrimiformis]|uniref:Sialate O-acetylesterase domain-containing protein n=1 Tax=Rubripirellula lacrimiformis TaxID=1930273 RepID=A0A517NLI6_9BACT|nr:LamG-like jellyroll fold domain-containing protein [Rubripirellula lacrimiformis]QDT07996.1 hypothetical protein K227x_64260 [Rubripirellula lacrimiformis]